MKKITKKIGFLFLVLAFLAVHIFAETPWDGKGKKEATESYNAQKADLNNTLKTKKAELTALLKSGTATTDQINAKLAEVNNAETAVNNIKIQWDQFKQENKLAMDNLKVNQATTKTDLNNKIKSGGSVTIDTTNFTLVGRDQTKAQNDNLSADYKAEKTALTASQKSARDAMLNVEKTDLAALKTAYDAKLSDLLNKKNLPVGDPNKITDAQYQVLVMAEASKYKNDCTVRKNQYSADKLSLKNQQAIDKAAENNKKTDIASAKKDGGAVTVNGHVDSVTGTTAAKAVYAAAKAALKNFQTAERNKLK